MSIENKIQQTVDLFPTDWNEIVKRAELLSSLDYSYEQVKKEFVVNEHKIVYYGDNDGAGNSMVLLLNHETHEALFIGFDHESNLNFFAREPEEALIQFAMYETTPVSFLDVIVNQEETYELLNVKNPVNGDTIWDASVVVVYKDGKWEPTPNYVKTAVDEDDDGGISYVSDSFTFNGDFEEWKQELLEDPEEHVEKAIAKYEQK